MDGIVTVEKNDIKPFERQHVVAHAAGQMMTFASEITKTTPEISGGVRHGRAHRDGDIHIHDLDFLTLTTTCCQIDLLKLFKGGFSTGHGFLREPNDIQSYSALHVSPSSPIRTTSTAARVS